MRRSLTKSMLFTALIAIGFMAASLISESAFAVPPFARKFNVSCQMCHSVPAKLNGVGRAFKRNGYFMPGSEGQVKGGFLSQPPETKSPFGFLLEVEIKYYPSADDKGKNAYVTDATMPEWEVFVAGNDNNHIGYLAIAVGAPGDSLGIEGAQMIFSDLFGVDGLNLKIGTMIGGFASLDFAAVGTGKISTPTGYKTLGNSSFSAENDVFSAFSTGFEVQYAKGSIMFGIGLLTGLGQDSESATDGNFQKDVYAYFEFHGAGQGGSSFWAGDLLTIRASFLYGTDDVDGTTEGTGTDIHVKRMVMTLLTEIWTGPIQAQLIFQYVSEKLDGSGTGAAAATFTSSGSKATHIAIVAEVDAYLMGGKFNPGIRFEMLSTTSTNGDGTTYTGNAASTLSKDPGQMWVHAGFSSLIRSNVWWLLGVRVDLKGADRFEFSKGVASSTNLSTNPTISVVEFKLVAGF